MGERRDGVNVGDEESQCDHGIDEGDEVVDGIIRGLESGQKDIEPEAISYFQSIADEELDVPGLEVPEKED